jgi:serine phosphatase RsbU (regulator of sigma subunit)
VTPTITIAIAAAAGAAVLIAGLVLAAGSRRRHAAHAADASPEQQAVIWRFIGAALESWSSEAVCWSLGDAVRTALGMGTVVLLEPGEPAWTARRPDGPAPAPRAQNVFAWFRHNPDLVLVSELGDKRFGGMRLHLEELARQYGADALLPLAHHGQLFHVVACGGRGRPLDAGERRMLGQLHLEAAAIAANARLYKEAATKLSLQQEVDAAGAVQQALLPRNGWQRVGGVGIACHYRGVPGGASDVFAAYEHDGRVTLVIGDIVGRGVAASMLAAVAKGCFDTAQGTEVQELLRILNGAIYRPGPRRPEMRCLVATIDLAAGVLRVASAGAPFPYVVGRDGGQAQVRAVLARGPLVGDLPQAAFPVVTQPLGADDALVLFTPGLIQAESPARDPYGDRRLLKVLRKTAAIGPSSLIDEVVDDLDRFLAGSTPREEVLLVVARPAAG